MLDDNTVLIEYDYESSFKMLNSIFLYQSSLFKLLKAIYENGFGDTIIIQTIIKILNASYEYIRLFVSRLDHLKFYESHCSIPIEIINGMEKYYESIYEFSRKSYASPYFRKNISQLTGNILRELNELKKLNKNHKDKNNTHLIWRSNFV
jgi:hypothetical protein